MVNMARPAKVVMAEIFTLAIKERRITQRDVAKLIGWSQPKVSRMCRGNLKGISLEKLFQALNLIGYDIKICLGFTSSKNEVGNANVAFNANSFGNVTFGMGD